MAAELRSRAGDGRSLWIAVVVGALALAAGYFAGRDAMRELLRCYLVGWTLLWGLGMGSLALVMVHHLTGGVWGLVLRRILEAQTVLVPLSGLLFVPIALQAAEI